MQDLSAKHYFPGLNGLRFISALLVIINHIESSKHYAGYPNYTHIRFFTAVGDLSVTFFFVLSGFLITYLLLTEKQNKGSIDIKKFYLKRSLRIWPLYFLVIALTLFLIHKAGFFHLPIPKEDSLDKLGLKGLLLLIVFPNIVATFYYIAYLGHIWSIGVEEQFYLIWPWLLKFFRNYIRMFFIVLLLFFAIGLALYLVKITTSDPSILKTAKDLKGCLSRMRINCMAIGGIGAWLVFSKKEKILNLIYKKVVQWSVLLLILVLYLTGPYIPLIKHEFYSVLFCLLIVNVATNVKPIVHLENKAFRFLGKISYGIYMYHPLVIGLCIGFLQQLKEYSFGSLWSDLILYLMVITATILISAFSYYFFESIFLKRKEKIAAE